MSGVRQAYDALVAAHELKPDPAQAAVADKLETGDRIIEVIPAHYFPKTPAV